jgi:hypothetical protein
MPLHCVWWLSDYCRRRVRGQTWSLKGNARRVFLSGSDSDLHQVEEEGVSGFGRGDGEELGEDLFIWR